MSEIDAEDKCLIVKLCSRFSKVSLAEIEQKMGALLERKCEGFKKAENFPDVCEQAWM